MEERTNIDYEKAYKAVLQTATQWIKDGCTDKERICLESVFPELRESEDEKMINEIINTVTGNHPTHTTAEIGSMVTWLYNCKESLHIQKTCKENADFFTDETEDERIRKEIIEYLKTVNEVESDCNHSVINEWIAYLERQKEYVSSNFDDVWNEEDCSEILAEGEKLTPKFKKLFKGVCHAWYDKGIELSRKQKEQKPLSPEDKVKHPLYVEGFEAGKEVGRQCEKVFGEQKPASSPITTDKRLDLEKSINVREYVYDKTDEEFIRGCANILVANDFAISAKRLLSMFPSKTAEWSEEDEKMLNGIIGRGCSQIPYTEPGLRGEQIDWLKNKLKSLRPQPRWKPSEEHLSALLAVFNDPNNIGSQSCQLALTDLYEQLLKLK